MSEQKMPALPEFTIFGRYVVERIQREAYEAGRQQERERLEPLRVAVEAAKATRYGAPAMLALERVFNTARNLLEQTE